MGCADPSLDLYPVTISNPSAVGTPTAFWVSEIDAQVSISVLIADFQSVALPTELLDRRRPQAQDARPGVEYTRAGADLDNGDRAETE